MFSQNIKEINGFDGYYIGSDGIVYSSKKDWGHITDLYQMHLRADKDGYLEVGMYSNGKRYFRRVHRIVADAFIPNPNHLPQVNHKDGNVQNNCVENLEWCTCADNLRHSFRVLGRNPSITTAIPIKLTNIQTNEVLYFISIKDCAFYLHMSCEHLGRLLNGRCNMQQWRLKQKYIVEYSNIEDVTTTCVHTACKSRVEVPNPLMRGEDIVYSLNKYRETEGIKGLRN